MPLIIETNSSPGYDIYVVIHNPDGTVWNTTLNAGAGGWETYNGGNWAQYAIPFTEQAGSGYYSAPYPAGISDILTTEVIYFNPAPVLGDLPGGIFQSQGSNIGAVFNDASVVSRFSKSLASMVEGAVIAGTLAANSFPTDVVNANTNAFRGRSLLFMTGVLAGQGGVILGYTPGTGVITIAGSFTGAPAIADQFIIS